ncbi:MAG: Gx transporter family protein, partial [Butyricicoccus sp.]|nr:Gx transporter family protein [Butyricicoccus sp.]
MKTKDIALCGLLVTVALVLSIIEKMFPLQAVVPSPGIKLGLANVVTVFAL